jgi:hypothetical protein
LCKLIILLEKKLFEFKNRLENKEEKMKGREGQRKRKREKKKERSGVERIMVEKLKMS